MDLANFITSTPSWALLLLIVAMGMVFTELGSWVGRRKFGKGIKEPSAPVDTAVSAILGLLAFMLGFTFSATSSRFSERKGLVIEQANAIGATYLQAGLLPEKQKSTVRLLCKEYAGLLLQLKDAKSVEELLSRRDRIHQGLWAQTVSLEKENLDSEIRSEFISAVINVMQLSEERKTVALVFKISDALWSALLLLTAMSMFAFGYQTGINGGRRVWQVPLLHIAFGLVIVLIADMDSPGLRRFQVSQQPLKNLQKMMEKNGY